MTYELLAKQFHSLGHPARLQLLVLLALGPLCVYDLVSLTGKRQPYISQHLAALRAADMVNTERKGLNVYYSINFVRLEALQAVIAQLSQLERNSTEDKSITQSKYIKDWYDIPHEQNEWRPTIIDKRYVGCGLCVTSCPQNVYAFDYEANKPVVCDSSMCLVGCTTCATLCFEDAVELPPVGYISKIIDKSEQLQQSANLLKVGKHKYDIKGFTMQACAGRSPSS